MTQAKGDASLAPSEAERLLLDHLARLQRGEPSDLEALCVAHPARAGELRELSARLALVARLLPDVHGEPPAAAGAELPSDLLALCARLSTRASVADRYEQPVEVARGAQGAVLDVFDADLRRHVAKKVLHGGATSAGQLPGGAGSVRNLGRFLDEAQVTAQLEHPGIVPVHELGLDAEGRLFFTMKLVRGQSLQQLLETRHGEPRGGAGWTTTRVVGALLRVAEAMAFAHDRGVIHRDLKPSNVMLGSYGEVYVMDWGLARAAGDDGHPETGDDSRAGHAGHADLAGHAGRGAAVRSARLQAGPDSDTSLLTLEGDIVGTPQYMSPEQAAGRLGDVGPRSDVYALGAMLYHVLAGRAPYALTAGGRDGAAMLPAAVLQRVRAGPPPPLRGTGRVPAELEAICEKAMARDPRQRYASMTALADDLRAFLESRVVRAHETGAFAELRKWVRRNRALTLASTAALTALVGGSLHASRVEAAGRAVAEAETQRADRSLASLLRLSDRARLARLRDQADALWPAVPAQIAPMQAWLVQARELVGRQELHRATLAELSARAAPYTAADAQRDLDTFPGAADLDTQRLAVGVRRRAVEREEADAASDATRRLMVARALAKAETNLARMEAERLQRRTWSFDAPEDGWWHATLLDLLAQLQDFAAVTLPGVEQRLASAQTIERLSIGDEQPAWDLAIASIADSKACPLYGGLQLAPQMGLVPLGRDPRSGLWEFADLPSGERARRAAPDGPLVVTPETGIVFVLLPGGSCPFGGQRADPAAPGYDRWLDPQFNRVQQVRLDPFFMAKHEVTQGQWERAMGSTPSTYFALALVGGRMITASHPVESVTWSEAGAMLARCGLALPTEAQWEYACRAGTTTTWWTGADVGSLAGAANIADSSLRSHTSDEWLFEPSLDDGWLSHAPVGSFRANAFGLHDTIGNVAEWTRDPWNEQPTDARPGDGQQSGGFAGAAASCGGGWSAELSLTTSAHRERRTIDSRDPGCGLRAARPVERRGD